MKLIKTLEDLLLRAYVGFRARTATSRGQGSLEYIAIAIGIVIVAAVAFAFFEEPIKNCGNNIIVKVFGTGTLQGTQCT